MNLSQTRGHADTGRACNVHTPSYYEMTGANHCSTLSPWKQTVEANSVSLQKLNPLPVLAGCRWLRHTQYGQDSVVFQDLHGARADEIDGLESVSLSDEELSRGAEGGLDDEGE